MVFFSKLITVALREFALPVPRVGSIESHSGYDRAAAEGQEIHFRVQKKRSRTEPAYKAEVPVAREFERKGYRFRIEGRMDGVFQTDPPKIEEIKTSFHVWELRRRLLDDPFVHPYGLQLFTYGYFYWLEHRILPSLFFHLVSTRSRDSLDLELKLEIPKYEYWLEKRLDELAAEAAKAEKRAARRKKVASEFAFPFQKTRPGQNELIETIDQAMADRQRMLIQAPTGLGKTAGVLFPVLRNALSRGQKVLYVTPKNSQHAVAEDAVSRFHDVGAKLKSLTITAKGKICFQNEPLCDPAYCDYARDYYTKLDRHGIPDLLAKRRKLKARIFRELGEQYQVCPFELQLVAAAEADVIICDYNYVFAPRSALGRINEITINQEGKPNLVIDEAHNLPARAMDYYSPALSTVTLESMRTEIRNGTGDLSGEAESLLDGCIGIILGCKTPDGRRPQRIDPPVEPFLEQDGKLRAFLTRYLDSCPDIQPRDPVLRLCFYWSAFAEALEYVGDRNHPEFFTTFHPHPTGGLIKITCCDASAMLEDCYDRYEHVIGFSATLKPFEYYVKLSGLNSLMVKTAEFDSPFPKNRRKLMIIPQISTRFSHRARNYPKIAEAIARIVSLRRGNYFAFFPSFEFLERVLSLFKPPDGFSVLKQERDMKLADVESVLDRLRGRLPSVLFAVQGGIFAEGVDYPGEMAIGAFVVGPPLPTFDLEREEMRAYYEREYGSGFDYAYAIPAMSKAIQAAGRVIRSETDCGLIVLLDGRFVQPDYSRAMPRDWFHARPDELVSDSILREVSEFWDRIAGV